MLKRILHWLAQAAISDEWRRLSASMQKIYQEMLLFGRAAAFSVGRQRPLLFPVESPTQIHRCEPPVRHVLDHF